MRKTRRLVIRTLETKDYLAWKEANLSQYKSQNPWDKGLPPEEVITKKEFDKYLKNIKSLKQQDTFYHLAVFEKKSNHYLGTVSAMNVIRNVSHTAFLGYFIFNNHWGKGYAKEAVMAFIDIAFKDLNLHRLEAGIEPNNRRSIMLARSLGFRKEGLKKRCVFLRNEWQDLTIYSITSEEIGITWKPKK